MTENPGVPSSGRPLSSGVVSSSSREELGTARWTTPDELRSGFAFDDSLFIRNDDNFWEGRSNGQIWIGETADGDSDPIGYGDERHVCLVSGSRGGKGTGIIIPNLCLWPGSALVIDPKGENATVTARRRGAGSVYCYGMGQTVCILDPFGEVQLDASLKGRFNPLDAIDAGGDFAVDDAGRIAASLVVSENQTDKFFEESALNLIKGLILHVLTDPDFEGNRNLVSVWRLVNQGDWQAVELLRSAKHEKIPSAFDLLWEGLRRNPRYNGLIAGIGEEMRSMADRTRDGIRKTAATHLDFIGGAPMQRVLEASDMDLARIKTDPKGLTIYLTLPQRYMKTHFRWLRLMTDLAIGEMERIKGRPATGYPTLFVLDEFAGLKRMEVIEHAAAQAAGFGAKFFFVVQSLGQLKEVYKESWETFIGNSGLKLYFNVEDDFTRAYLSRQFGEREVRRGTTSGSHAETVGHTVTEGHSSTTTTGTGTSEQTGHSEGTSASRSKGGSSGWTKGKTSGESRGNIIGQDFFGGETSIHNNTTTSEGSNTSRSRGKNWSQSTGTNSSLSESISRSRNQSESQGTNSSVARSSTVSNTAGWSDTVHKRLLLNPDEIGRLFAPIADINNPAYPGLIATLIVGEQPALVRRVNYFQSPRFAGFYDPHPDHRRPLTLEELAILARLPPIEEAPPEYPILEPPVPLDLPLVRLDWRTVSIAGAAILLAIAAVLVILGRSQPVSPPTDARPPVSKSDMVERILHEQCALREPNGWRAPYCSYYDSEAGERKKDYDATEAFETLFWDNIPLQLINETVDHSPTPFLAVPNSSLFFGSLCISVNCTSDRVNMYVDASNNSTAMYVVKDGKCTVYVEDDNFSHREVICR